MGIIDKITDIIRRILGLKKKVLVERVLKDEDISQLDKEIELERGYKEGKISALEEENKDLKISLSPKDINVAEYLTKQKKQMYYKQFQNALSLKKLFSLGIIKKKSIKVVSYNSKKVFGNFHDLLVRNDGRLTVIIDNNGKKEPVMVGRTVKDMFTNYEGLTNNVGLGFLQLNLDEEGRFVENVLEQEIPEMVIDAEGAYWVSQVNNEKFVKQLMQKDETINELYGMIGAYERELHKLTSNRNIQKIITKFNENRASTAETELAKAVNQVTEINKNYNDLSREMVTKGNAQYISEQKVEQLEDVKDKLITKMNEIFSKHEVELAREQYVNMANDIMDITQGAKINIVTAPQSKPAETESRLTEKFNKA